MYSANIRERENTSGAKGLGLFGRRRDISGAVVVFGIVSQVVGELEAFLQKLCYASLSIGYLFANHELAVYPHVVN